MYVEIIIIEVDAEQWKAPNIICSLKHVMPNSIDSTLSAQLPAS